VGLLEDGGARWALLLERFYLASAGSVASRPRRSNLTVAEVAPVPPATLSIPK